ncbi:MAG: nucleoside 2-deoxyribosyltransferase [Candidatus Shapirobacteria bacterium]|jgi:nucleoside 2-deoxyribosyltransferase
MIAYLIIKYYPDNRNGRQIENLAKTFKKLGMEVIVGVDELNKMGSLIKSPKALMAEAFKLIDRADMVIVEFSEKGVGIGVEAGYAFAKGKTVIVIAKEKTQISETMEGIANQVVYYNDINDLEVKITRALKNVEKND